MTFSKLLTAAVVLWGSLFQMSSSFARAGGEVSGGADSFMVSQAFFLGLDANKKIDLCYEASPQFGVPDAEIEGDVRWAFTQWSSYVEAKDLKYAIWTKTPGIVGAVGSLKKGCNGNEDLRLFFGVEKPEVTQFRPRFIDPYAFSAITDTSSDGNWSRGLLWIAGPGQVDPKLGVPTWNKPQKIPFGAFKYTLLHEIGHIFGNGHVDSTIMTGRIGQWLEEWTNPSQTLPQGPEESDLEIDQQVELIPNLNLGDTVRLAVQYGCIDRTCPDQSALAKAYERIFSVKSVGALSAVAVRSANPSATSHARPDDLSAGTGVVELRFNDDRGTHIAKLSTSVKVAESIDSTDLFNGQYGDHYWSFGASFLGTIEAPGGSPVQVLVNWNMGDRLEIIDLAGGSLSHPLLRSE